MKISLRNRYINIGLKLLILALLAFSLYKQLSGHQNHFEEFREQYDGLNLFLVIIVFAMMTINWTIESVKWKILVNKITSISFWKSVFGILSGITVSIFTPNRIGEYGGRILLVPNRHKLKTIIVTLTGSFAQIIATITFGSIAFAWFLYSFYAVSDLIIWLYCTIVFSLYIMLIIGYYNLRLTYQVLERIPILNKLKRLIRLAQVYSELNSKELTRILFLSHLRYIVFAVQYLLLLQIFGVGTGIIDGMVMIACIFFVQSVFPTPAIIELGIRFNVSIYFIGYLSNNELGIILSAASLWLINLMIPAIIGSIVILRTNIMGNNK